MFIVDIRGSMAYRIDYLPSSINIRDDQLEELLSQGSPFPTGNTIVFVCPIGEQSRRLAFLTRRTGQEAVSLAGGMTAWCDTGLPLETNQPQ